MDEHDHGHYFRNRASVIYHLRDAHQWNEDTLSSVDGASSPDPLGWHTAEGGYIVTTGELLAIHRELTSVSASEARRCE